MKQQLLCRGCGSQVIAPYSFFSPPFLPFQSWNRHSLPRAARVATARLQLESGGWSFGNSENIESEIFVFSNDQKKLEQRLQPICVSYERRSFQRQLVFQLKTQYIWKMLLLPINFVNYTGQILLRKMTGTNRILKETVAGATAEATAEIVLYPLDTLKVRLQSTGKLTFWKSFSSATGRHIGVYGPASALRTTQFSELYKGVGQSVLGVLPTAAVFAIVYHNMKRFLSSLIPENNRKRLRPLTSLVAGALGTTISSLVEAPTELIKSRLQAGIHHSVAEAFRTALVSEHGFRGLYRGARSNLLRNLPFDALEFACFETLKDVYLRIRSKTHLEKREMLLLGAFVGGVIGAVTTPFDVVYTRLVTQPSKYLNATNTLKIIYREEGIQGLFCGLLPRIGWESANSGVFFFVFDGMMQSFDTTERQRK
eukprot:jgi/Galph1/3496/GphlegSOOS_G2157.1